MGRIPEPVADLIARGSRTANAKREEVVATGGRPELPTHLASIPEMVAIHKELCDTIAAMGILSKDDALSIENATCNVYKLRRMQLKSIDLPPDEAADVEALIDRYERRLTAFQDRFAMSPASRVKVRVAKGTKVKSAIERFLTKPTGNGTGNGE